MPVNSTALRVTWEEPNFADQNGILQNYFVTYSIMGSALETLVEVGSNEVTLGGLEEFTIYEITVNASTNVGVGPGATVTIRTPVDGK